MLRKTREALAGSKVGMRVKLKKIISSDMVFMAEGAAEAEWMVGGTKGPVKTYLLLQVKSPPAPYISIYQIWPIAGAVKGQKNSCSHRGR